MSIFPSTHNQRGMALLNVVFLFIFIGVLVASGMQMFGSMVARGKINVSKSGLENQVKAIIAWAAKNGRLPTGTEYATTVFGSTAPLDAWGKSVVYVYDNNLAATATGGVCGRTSTNLSDSGATSVPFAFALVSGGDDFTFDTQVNSSTVTASPNPYLPVTVAWTISNYQKDIYKAVPLEELKSKAGCYGPTGGRLAIVNNELPTVCVGSTYNATVYPTGGVPNYTWNNSNAPIWLSFATTGTNYNLSSNINPITSSATNLTFTLNDSNSNSVSRILPIKVGYKGACAGASIACAANPACLAACLADPVCKAACPTCTAVPAITFNNPPTDTVSDNWNGGEVTDTGLHSQGSKIDFILDPTIGTMSAISGHQGTSTNCIWYQSPQTLTGKKLRAYFNFSIQPYHNEGFVFVLMPAQGRLIATNSCNPNANDDVNKQHDSMGFGPGIPGYGSTLIGVEFPAFDFSTCISTDGVQCNGTDNSWFNNGYAYNVRIELDATVSPYVLNEWLCPVGSDTCSATDIAALKDLSAPIPTPYSVTLTPYVSATLTQPQIDALSQFFIGFTASQQGNDQISLVLSGLKFRLY